MKTCDQPTNVQEGANRFMFFLNAPILGAITLIGLTTNSITIAVFCRRAQKSFQGLKPYLLCMALWDVLLLLTGWLVFSLPTLLSNDGMVQPHGNIVYLYFILYPLSNMAYMGRSLSKVLASFELYLAICHPLWHKITSFKRRVKFALGITTAVVIGVNITRFFDYAITACYSSPPVNATLVDLEPYLMNVDIYVTAYITLIQLCFVTVGPMIALILIGHRIIVRMRGAFSEDSSVRIDVSMGLEPDPAFRRHSSVLEQQQSRLARMMIFVMTTYIMCNILPTVLDIMHVANSKYILESENYHVLADCSNVLVMSQAASNFFVYFSYQPSFRRACRTILTHATSTTSDGQNVTQIPTTSRQNTNDSLSPRMMEMETFYFQNLQLTDEQPIIHS